LVPRPQHAEIPKVSCQRLDRRLRNMTEFIKTSANKIKDRSTDELLQIDNLSRTKKPTLNEQSKKKFQ
jgi:hypothetical protein